MKLCNYLDLRQDILSKMPGCAMYGCNSYSRRTKGSNIRYYTFPKQPDLAEQWINACRRKDKINLKNACVCSLHFDESSFQIEFKHKLLGYAPRNNRNIKADAVPNVATQNNLLVPQGKEEINNKRASAAKKRSDRLNKRRRKLEVDTASSECNGHVESVTEGPVKFRKRPNILSRTRVNKIPKITPNIFHETQQEPIVESNLPHFQSHQEQSEIMSLRNEILILKQKNSQLLTEIELIKLERNKAVDELKEVKKTIAEKVTKVLERVFTPG